MSSQERTYTLIELNPNWDSLLNTSSEDCSKRAFWQSSMGDSSRPLTVLANGRLGVGRFAEVQRITDTTTNESYALKLLLNPKEANKLVDEMQVYRLLDEQYNDKDKATDYKPFPANCKLVWVDEPILGNDGRLGLRMPLLTMPLLTQWVRDQQAHISSTAFEVEQVVWGAALTYFDLIEKQVKMGQITYDRKQDTFWWDTSKKRLIVTDWNAMSRVASDSRERALRNFAQVWFTLLTAKQGHLLSSLSVNRANDLLNDILWGHVSLEGRRILIELNNSLHPDLSEFKKRVEQLILDISDGKGKVVERFSQAQREWQSLLSGGSSVGLGFIKALCDVDLARRWGIPETDDVFEQMRSAWGQYGRPAKTLSYEVLTTAPKIDVVWRKLYAEAADCLTRADRFERSRYEQTIYGLLSAFSSLPITAVDRSSLYSQLTSAYDSAKKRLADYKLELDNLIPTLRLWIDLLRDITEMEQAWAAGLQGKAKEHYQRLIQESDERLNALGINKERLNKEFEFSQSLPDTDSLGDLGAAFVEAARKGKSELENLQQTWHSLIESSKLTPMARHVLHEAIEDVNVWLVALETNFYDGEAGYRLARRLARLTQRYPALADFDFLQTLEFVQTLNAAFQKAYNDAQTDFETTDKQKKRLGNSLPLLENALFLSGLLTDIMTGLKG